MSLFDQDILDIIGSGTDEPDFTPSGGESLVGTYDPHPDVSQWSDIIDTAIAENPSKLGFDIDKNWINRIIEQESGGDQFAESYAGATGIMQLMPETAESLGVLDSTDPEDNIRGGVKLIAQLLDKYDGDKRKVMAAYNGGESGVDKAVEKYGEQWLAHLDEFKGEDSYTGQNHAVQTWNYIDAIEKDIPSGPAKTFEEDIAGILGIDITPEEAPLEEGEIPIEEKPHPGITSLEEGEKIAGKKPLTGSSGGFPRKELTFREQRDVVHEEMMERGGFLNEAQARFVKFGMDVPEWADPKKMDKEDRFAFNYYNQMESMKGGTAFLSSFAGGMVPFSEGLKTGIQKKAEKEAPIAAGTGKVAGVISAAVIGGAAINSQLAKIPFVKESANLMGVIGRTATAGAVSAGQQEWKKDFGLSMRNTLVSMGAGAVSMIPEIYAPAGVWQLLAQPLADVLYDAGMDKMAGKKVMSLDFVKRNWLNWALAEGFAIKDVATGAQFKVTQATQRAEINNFINKYGNKGFEVLKKAVTPKPKAKKYFAPGAEGRIKTTVEKYREKELGVGVKEPEKIRKVTEVEEEAEVIGRKGGLEAKRPVKRGYEEYTKEEIEEAHTTLLRESERAELSYEQAREKLDIEIEGVEFASKLRQDFQKDLGFKTTTGDQWQKLTGKKLRDKEGNLIKLDPEIEKKLTGIAEAYNLIKKEGRGASQIDAPPEKILNEIDNWSADDVANLISQGMTKGDFGTFKKEWEGLSAKAEEEYEVAFEEIGKRGEAVSHRMDQLEMKQPKVNESFEVDEFSRQRGFEAVAGRIGPGKQYKIDVSKVKGDVEKVQSMQDQQREAVKDKYGFNSTRFVDKWLSRTIDVSSPVTRRLLKNDDGKKVVMHHDQIRGAPGESLRQYEIGESETYKTILHEHEEIFADFRQARRTVELSKLKGKEFKSPGGLGAKENQAWLDELKNQNPKLYKNFEDADKKFQKAISTDQLNQAVDEGLMTRKDADQLLKEHPHYNPRYFIQRIDPDVKSFDSQGRIINVPDSGIERLAEGSEQALLNNPRLALGNTISRMQTRIFKNKANKSLREFAIKNPENSLGVMVEKPIGKTEGGKPKYADVPAGMTRIQTMIDGQPKPMLMPTEMAKYWVASDPKINRNLANFINIASGSALLKPMATGYNPGFAISNTPRDMVHSWFVTEEYSPILPVAWAQQAKDFFTVKSDVVRRKGVVTDYIKEGGSMDFLTQQGQLRKRPWETQTTMDEAVNQIGKYAGYVGETSELWTRMALRERAIKNGKTPQEASYIARNYIDFSQGGSWVKAADKAVPYLGAGVQGTRGIVRAFKKNPAIASFKAAQVMGLGFGLAYWAKNVAKECWESISDREKATKFIIPTNISWKDKDGNKRWLYFPIAKDQGQRIFATIGEELANVAHGEDVNFDKLKMAATDFLPVGISNIPPSFSALFGYIFNKDFWRNEDIWKGRKGVTPKEEYWNNTPKAWVLWGKASSLSPERSKRAFHKVMPQNIYTYLMGAANNQFFGTLDEDDKSKVNEHFLNKLTEFPVIQRMARKTYPVSDKREEETLKKASKYQLDTHKDNGEPIPYRKLKSRVEKAENDAADLKIQLDRQFRFLASISLIGNEDSRSELKTEFAKLKDDYPAEYRRVARMIRREYPEALKYLK